MATGSLPENRFTFNLRENEYYGPDQKVKVTARYDRLFFKGDVQVGAANASGCELHGAAGS